MSNLAHLMCQFLYFFPPREVWVQPGWGAEKENENSLGKIVSRIILVKTLIIDFFKFDKTSYNLSRLDMRMEVEYPQEVIFDKLFL